MEPVSYPKPRLILGYIVYLIERDILLSLISLTVPPACLYDVPVVSGICRLPKTLKIRRKQLAV